MPIIKPGLIILKKNSNSEKYSIYLMSLCVFNTRVFLKEKYTNRHNFQEVITDTLQHSVKHVVHDKS